jgi:branched-chain amino acid transport system substrate-binding protein
MKKSFELLLLIALILLTAGCKSEQYIIIGFTNELSGTHSELGINSLYGVQIAVDEINENGGVNGKKLKLIIRNDQGDTKLANKYNQELIDLGAVVIIGHSTSKMANEVIDYANKNDFLIISPTISTRSIGGLDDNFIRLIPSDDVQAKSISDYFINKNTKGGMLLVYDSSNSEYSLSLANKIEELYELSGSQIEENNYISFLSSSQDDLEKAVNSINSSENRNIVIIGSVYDTSVIVQSIEAPELYDVYISLWGATNYLLEIAGQNLYNSHGDGFLPQIYSDEMLHFESKHEELFGIKPGYSAVFGYEAVYVLFEALKISEEYSPGTLKEAIINVEYQGLTSTFTIDEYGDVIRPIYSYIITEAGYEVIDDEKTN